MFEVELKGECHGQIVVPIGTTNGEAINADLSSIPSMLVSGTTGSGKTSFVQSLLLEMMQKYTPDDFRYILFDSKKIDYGLLYGTKYSLLPMIESTKLSGVLKWLCAELQYRYDRILEVDDLPHIFLVLDDCGEILKSGNVVDEISTLLYKARRVKIHCWLVTSTPTTEVISTELKANIPSRVAFHVTTRSLSRAVIGVEGAETLRSPGEMIFKHNSEMVRAEAYCYEEQMSAVIHTIESRWVKYESVSMYNDLTYIIEPPVKVASYQNRNDFYFASAGRFIIEHGRASIGVLQRVYRLGFDKAARIMDQLAESGVVGPEEGTKPRKILMTSDEFELLLQGKPVTTKTLEHVNPLVVSKENKPSESQRIISGAEPESSVQSKRRAGILLKQSERKILTPHAYICGTEYALGVTKENVFVRRNDRNEILFVAPGNQIESINVKKPGVFTNGCVTICSVNGQYVEVAFKKSDTKEFYCLIEQLAHDIGKTIGEK